MLDYVRHCLSLTNDRLVFDGVTWPGLRPSLRRIPPTYAMTSSVVHSESSRETSQIVVIEQIPHNLYPVPPSDATSTFASPPVTNTLLQKILDISRRSRCTYPFSSCSAITFHFSAKALCVVDISSAGIFLPLSYPAKITYSSAIPPTNDDGRDKSRHGRDCPGQRSWPVLPVLILDLQHILMATRR